MAEELQGLLNRIQQDGIEKSEAERAKIVADAEAKAAKIIADAEAKADAVVKDAEAQSAALEKKAKESIRQAARDVVIALKSEMQDRLNRVAKNAVGEALTPEQMAGIVQEMVKSYAANPTDNIEILLPEGSRNRLESGLMNALAADLRDRAKILGEPELEGGLQIGFHDGEVFLDFSDDALADRICSYIGPKLSAILKD